MQKHKINREGDEYTCTCGLRWDIDEDDPHPAEGSEQCVQDGWYFVTFKTSKPDDDHCETFDDWCEFSNGKWLIDEYYQEHFYEVVKVIRSE